ncbi:MAG: hypothetical protein IIW01_03210, partial [Thermoguttaceae bacterium]|nr:hypothetical protein [Thermoguttaceae bacterium]
MFARPRRFFLNSSFPFRLISFRLIPLFLVVLSYLAPPSCATFCQADVSNANVPSKKSTVSPAAPSRDRAAIFAEYQEKLRANAKICDERGMTLEGKITRSLLFNDEPYLFTLPTFK